MADYAAKPTKAKEDASIIDLRKRMLTVFLNRCRRMQQVLEDGVWWRFLDPNASWVCKRDIEAAVSRVYSVELTDIKTRRQSEVLHSPPASLIPKNILKASPLDPAHSTPAHNYLPVPSNSAKLKSASGSTASGTPVAPPSYASTPSTAAHTIPGPQVFGRFPPTAQNLSEQDLDPYFAHFETSTRELELLLQGNIEKVNRRTLNHLSSLAVDLAELGARYNAFSLSEPSPSLAAAIERIGQAVDSSYIATEELSSSLGITFAEPMRESAQFAGVVRSVLRFRILKRVQEEMTREDLLKKKNLLESLERSEMEAKRIDRYITSNAPSRPAQSSSTPNTASQPAGSGPNNEDTASIDSDFPPTHGDATSPKPSATQGAPQRTDDEAAEVRKRSASGGNFVTNKIFGRLSHAMHGIVDVDPERTRRDQIGKTKESLAQVTRI